MFIRVSITSIPNKNITYTLLIINRSCGTQPICFMISWLVMHIFCG